MKALITMKLVELATIVSNEWLPQRESETSDATNVSE